MGKLMNQLKIKIQSLVVSIQDNQHMFLYVFVACDSHFWLVNPQLSHVLVA
jgi:hypothetical protein